MLRKSEKNRRCITTIYNLGLKICYSWYDIEKFGGIYAIISKVVAYQNATVA